MSARHVHRFLMRRCIPWYGGPHPYFELRCRCGKREQTE